MHQEESPFSVTIDGSCQMYVESEEFRMKVTTDMKMRFYHLICVKL